MKTWQRNVGLSVIAILLPVFCFMLYNLGLYQNAPQCPSSSIKSRSCITMVPGSVVKAPDKREVTTCSGSDCSEHNEYDITIAVPGGKNQVVSIGDARSDIAPGDAISIIKLNGNSIGVDSHDRRSYEYGWHPSLLRFMLVTSVITLILLGIAFLYDMYESKTSKSIALFRAPITMFAAMASWSQGAFWVIAYFLMLITLLMGAFSHMLT